MNWRTTLWFALCGAPLWAQAGVRLTRVPERVVLPAGRGQNLMVEVEVARADEVFLARDAQGLDRVPLVATGVAGWQLNLADLRVARLLPADRDHGELFVFARIGGPAAGQLVQSAAIDWSRASPPGGIECIAIDARAARKALPVDGTGWFDPSTAERLELLGAAAAQVRAVAHAGDVVLPLAAHGDAFVLALNDALRRDLQRAGELALEVQLGGSTRWFVFGVVPDRLAPAQPAFTVKQRAHAFVPGSRDWFEVRLDDITMGQVLLTVVDASGAVVAPQQSVHERDHVVLPLAGGDWVLVVDRLHNLLVGDDWADLRVVPAATFRPDPIAVFLQRVEAAQGVTFVREGKDYAPAMAAEFLRARASTPACRQMTLAQFVVAASHSSRTGAPYHVRRANGEQVEAEVWFGELAKAIGQPDAR